jgi:hypothetical protein
LENSKGILRLAAALARNCRCACYDAATLHSGGATVIYELRVYEVMPGRMNDLQKRFAEITHGYFEKHGIKEVGYWTATIGTSNELIYMLSYPDLAHREKAWAAFGADKERQAKFAETEKNGPLVARIRASILAPTYFSPMK